jgi:hypothetical protein
LRSWFLDARSSSSRVHPAGRARRGGLRRPRQLCSHESLCARGEPRLAAGWEGGRPRAGWGRDAHPVCTGREGDVRPFRTGRGRDACPVCTGREGDVRPVCTGRGRDACPFRTGRERCVSGLYGAGEMCVRFVRGGEEMCVRFVRGGGERARKVIRKLRQTVLRQHQLLQPGQRLRRAARVKR